MVKLAIITDIHHGPDRGTKKGTKALEFLQEFAEFCALENPDFIVDIGDRISDVDKETDKHLLYEVHEVFQKIPFKKFHLLGNHDVAELTITENEEIMKTSFQSSRFDKNNMSFIFWNPPTYLDDKTGFTMDEKSILWLENELKLSKFPTTIFSHVPLDNGSMVGNFYFEKKYAHQAHYPSKAAEKIREIIEKSNKVVLCLNGHTHWTTYHSIDDIHYVTIPSLTETFLSYPEPQKAWALLTLGDDLIDIQIFGERPSSFSFKMQAFKHHWRNLDKDYAPKGEDPL